MKVKSFSVGMVNGVDGCLETLDKMVAELGQIEIHSLVDTTYPEEMSLDGPCPGPRVARVVVYSSK